MHKQPRDHIRLIRAFDIPPTKYTAAAWSTGVFSLLTALDIPGRSGNLGGPGPPRVAGPAHTRGRGGP